MAATIPRYMGRVRNLRLLSVPRKRLKRGGQPAPPPPVTYRLLAENGNVITTEAANPLRLEQS